MNTLSKIACLLLICLLVACGDNDRFGPSSEWTIPSDEVMDGGPGKDGIPSIDSPQFDQIDDVDFMDDEDLIVGIVKDGEAKAYPHKILDWHEIVNDKVGEQEIALTYCPLTGTAIAWDRNVNGVLTEFGVSGKLYNSNLIPYDRETDSYWSQMDLSCVNGALLNMNIVTHHVIETKWQTWKELFPDAMVLNRATGFNRDYSNYPYGDYRTNDSNLLFPVNNDDDRLPAKERVLSIIGPTASKAYSIELFDTPKVIIDVVDGTEMIIIGDKEQNILLAFENNLDLTNLFIAVNQLPVVATRPDGTKIYSDGSIQGGPSDGAILDHPETFIGYWFALGAFYPDMEIYEL